MREASFQSPSASEGPFRIITGVARMREASFQSPSASEGPYSRHDQRPYVHHLHSYVFDEVRVRSDHRQHPFLSLPWVVESFVVR